MSTKAACFVSKIIDRLNEDSSEEQIIDMSDLSREQTKAFADLVNSVDSAWPSPMHCPVVFKDSLHLLIPPVHKYDCPFVWKRILATLRAHPSLSSIMEMDGIVDIDVNTWLTTDMALVCVECMQKKTPDNLPWSERLSHAILKLLLSRLRVSMNDSRKEATGESERVTALK